MSDPIREGILPKYFVCVSFSRLLCTIIWRYVGSTKTIWETSSMQEWGEKRVGQRKEHMEEGVAFLHRRLLRRLSVRFSLLSALINFWEQVRGVGCFGSYLNFTLLWYNCAINTQLTFFLFFFSLFSLLFFIHSCIYLVCVTIFSSLYLCINLKGFNPIVSSEFIAENSVTYFVLLILSVYYPRLVISNSFIWLGEMKITHNCLV